MENKKGLPMLLGRNMPRVARRTIPMSRLPRQQVIGSKDLDTQRVAGPDKPPQQVSNPPITRKTRFTIPYTGTAVNYLVTPAAIAANDALEYFGASTPIRFNQLQVAKCQAWFGTINDPTSASYPVLEVIDNYSNVTFYDTPNGGVDWAHVAMRPCLSLRQTFFAVSGTSALFSIVIPAAEGCTGNIVVDVTFTGQ
jgi:hypothetical protein